MSKTRCQRFAIVAGNRPPAMSVSWEKPLSRQDSGYVVIYSDVGPDDDPDESNTGPVCLDCLVDEGGEQLGRGLDLAKRYGQVDYDLAADEWYVPGGVE